MGCSLDIFNHLGFPSSLPPARNHRPTLPKPGLPRPSLPRATLLRPSLPAPESRLRLVYVCGCSLPPCISLTELPAAWRHSAVCDRISHACGGISALLDRLDKNYHILREVGRHILGVSSRHHFSLNERRCRNKFVTSVQKQTKTKMKTDEKLTTKVTSYPDEHAR